MCCVVLVYACLCWFTCVCVGLRVSVLVYACLCWFTHVRLEAPGERDLILMRHSVGISWPDQSQEDRHIDLVVYGDEKKYSAMAATVGFPTAIAAKMILEGSMCTILYSPF